MHTHASRARLALVSLALAALACNSLAQPGGTRPPSPTPAVDKTPAAPLTSTPPAAPTAITVPIATSTIPSMLAIAVRLDGGLPTLQGYLGDPAQGPFEPTAGRYYIEVLDAQGLSLSLGAVDVVSGTAVALPASVAAAGGQADPQQASLLTTLGKFLIEAQLTKLAAYEAASNGFTTRLFDPAAQPGQAELDQLQAHFAELSRQEPAVLAAADQLQTQIPAALIRPGGAGAGRLAAPAPGLKDALLGFFGYARDTGKRARERIVKIAAGLSPDEKLDAFNSVRAGFKGDAQNFDDFLAQLSSGALDKQAAQIESDMRNAPGFATGAQQTGNTVDQVVKREGGELVTKGVELDVEVIKTVLGQLSPKLTEGYDLAEKGAKWAQYIHDFYTNPLNAAEQLTREQLTEKIKARIKSDLAACCPNLSGDAVDQIAGAVSDQAVGAIPPLTLNADQLAGTATQQGLETQQALAGAQQQTAEAAATNQALDSAQQTAEAAATLTAIARLTENAIPPTEVIPSATPTFEPVVVETLAHPGNVFGVSTKTVLQLNHLYQFCFSGQVFLINPDRAVLASDIDHVDGVKVPASECLTLAGTGKAAVISCGEGEIAQDPGGFEIVVTDLGPQ